MYYTEGDSYIKNNKVHLQYKKNIIGREIYSGDIIKVNEGAICSIYFEDGKTQLVIDSNSRVQIIQTDMSKEIKINQGSVYIRMRNDEMKKCCLGGRHYRVL